MPYIFTIAMPTCFSQVSVCHRIRSLCWIFRDRRLLGVCSRFPLIAIPTTKKTWPLLSDRCGQIRMCSPIFTNLTSYHFILFFIRVTWATRAHGQYSGFHHKWSVAKVSDTMSSHAHEVDQFSHSIIFFWNAPHFSEHNKHRDSLSGNTCPSMSFPFQFHGMYWWLTSV